jgi:hypothetical protein
MVANSITLLSAKHKLSGNGLLGTARALDFPKRSRRDTLPSTLLQQTKQRFDGVSLNDK